jgi:hypothetical protein
MPSKSRIVASLILALVSAAIVGIYYVFAPDSQDPEFRRASESFAAQVNKLGSALGPGEQGVVTLDLSGSHQLILLAPYCPKNRVESCAGRNQKLVDSLARMAMSDANCPALIWLRDGKIVAIKKARLETAIYFQICCWTLKDHLAVRVEKEASSPNPFLSLRFVEDQSP